MENATVDKSKLKECHDQCAEYLKKAAELQKKAGESCSSGNEDQAKIANYESMGYLFAAMKHFKKAAKHAAGIQCKCCKEDSGSSKGGEKSQGSQGSQQGQGSLNTSKTK